MSETLICLGCSNDPVTRPDREQSLRFKKVWNERYPDYPVRVKDNPHDLGPYASVEIAVYLFSKGLKESETFPDGIEMSAVGLADELGLDY